MPAKPLTKNQHDDAARLKTLFRAWQDKRKEEGQASSQAYCSGILGFGQSTIVQYLNGKIPLNPNAARRFASLLGVTVDVFSPDLAQRIADLAAGVSAMSSGSIQPGETVPMPLQIGSTTSKKREGRNLKEALATLAAAIEATDDLDWTQGSALLRRLAEEPGRARDILERLEPLLAARRGAPEADRVEP